MAKILFWILVLVRRAPTLKVKSSSCQIDSKRAWACSASCTSWRRACADGSHSPTVCWAKPFRSLDGHVRLSNTPRHEELNFVTLAEMIFGVTTALGFCRGGDLGQCLAHYIMGSAFIGYAVILVIMLNLGGEWLARLGCSQEMLDSSVITVWVSQHFICVLGPS